VQASKQCYRWEAFKWMLEIVLTFRHPTPAHSKEITSKFQHHLWSSRKLCSVRLPSSSKVVPCKVTPEIAGITIPKQGPMWGGAEAVPILIMPMTKGVTQCKKSMILNSSSCDTQWVSSKCIKMGCEFLHLRSIPPNVLQIFSEFNTYTRPV